ncbi:MAG: hypothetical protein ACI8PB_003084 [Desulforhopalus sp.]|jgi:hypothetical protein
MRVSFCCEIYINSSERSVIEVGVDLRRDKGNVDICGVCYFGFEIGILEL